MLVSPPALNFRTLFESVPGALLVVVPNDPVYTIVAVTDSYERAAKRTRDALLGRERPRCRFCLSVFASGSVVIAGCRIWRETPPYCQGAEIRVCRILG